MTRNPKVTVIDQNGEPDRMSQVILDTIPDIKRAAAATFNNVTNGLIDPRAAKEANSATKIALDANMQAFQTMRQSEVAKEVLQAWVAQVCLPQYMRPDARAIAGTPPAGKPKRQRRQKDDTPNNAVQS